MNDDEKDFLIKIYQERKDTKDKSVRDIIASSGINHKRAWYLLEKWAKKDWYDYGVNLELGWLTDTGIERAKILEETIE